MDSITANLAAFVKDYRFFKKEYSSLISANMQFSYLMENADVFQTKNYKYFLDATIRP